MHDKLDILCLMSREKSEQKKLSLVYLDYDIVFIVNNQLDLNTSFMDVRGKIIPYTYFKNLKKKIK